MAIETKDYLISYTMELKGEKIIINTFQGIDAECGSVILALGRLSQAATITLNAMVSSANMVVTAMQGVTQSILQATSAFASQPSVLSSKMSPVAPLTPVVPLTPVAPTAPVAPVAPPIPPTAPVAPVAPPIPPAVPNLIEKYANMMGRALMVMPIWMALRLAFQTVSRTINENIQSYKDLDDQMARIQTVTQGTTATVVAQMDIFKDTILTVAKDSRISLQSLAEGFYFLKTANLSASEALAAYAPTVALATGTNNNLTQSARAVAGMYNTMGKYIGNNLTETQKFQKISDVLAFTYTKQDVQLGELIESYTKLAPYLTGLTINFQDVVTMLGVANTNMLRGGRAGLLLGQAIQQITKHAQTLHDEFGITFDPKKPIDLIGIIGQIRDSMQLTGKITAEQGEKLRKVFDTRGQVPIRIFLEHFQKLKDEIGLAGENLEGFAKKIADIRMGTITAQEERLKNITADLTETLLTAAFGTKNLADTLKLINDSLINQKPTVKALGEQWKSLNGIMERHLTVIMAVADYKQGLREREEKGEKISPFEAYLGERKVVTSATKEYWQSQVNRDIASDQRELDRQRYQELSQEQDKYKKQVIQEEAKGAEADRQKTAILIKNIDNIENKKKKLLGDETTYRTIVATLETEDQRKLDRKNSIYQRHIDKIEYQADLLKANGTMESDIIKFKMAQLRATENITDAENIRRSILKDIHEQEIEIANIKQKGLEQYRTGIINMARAEGEEREKIRTFLKLQALSPKALAQEYEHAAGMGERKTYAVGTTQFTGNTIRDLILQGFNQLSAEQQTKVGPAVAREMGVPYTPERFMTQKLPTPTANIGAINVNLPKELAGLTIDNITNKIKEALLNEPIFNRWVIDNINNMSERDVK